VIVASSWRSLARLAVGPDASEAEGVDDKENRYDAEASEESSHEIVAA